MAHSRSDDLNMADEHTQMSELDQKNGTWMSEDSESEFLEDDADMGKPETDTSASEAKNGKDIQGILWCRFNSCRDKYREMRVKQFKNFENIPLPKEDVRKECKQVDKRSTFYDFQFNTRTVKSTIVHFQLRNLVSATSKHDVYLTQNHSIMHWSSVLRRSKEILNVAHSVDSTLKDPGTISHPLSQVHISTMTVKDNLLIAGGFHGELICKNVNDPGVLFSTKLTVHETDMTNSVDAYDGPSGAMRVITATNDAQVRVFDTEKFSCLNRFSYGWSVNHTSVGLDGKLLAVLGDSTDCLIADAQSGKAVATLKGHLDYSFSSAWHPDGRILATGNQDTTCRLWDIRNMSKSMQVLKGQMGAIRTLKFSSDGRFMAMAEPADFVHIFDTQSGNLKQQEIDIFGDIAGISFSPDSEALFIGIADRRYGSLMEFTRRHHSTYQDCIL